MTEHRYRQWLVAELATNHYLNQWWPRFIKLGGTNRIDELQQYSQDENKYTYFSIYGWNGIDYTVDDLGQELKFTYF